MVQPKFNYYICDTAKAGANLATARELNPLNRSLYEGSADEDMNGIAPYLFTVEDNLEFEKWLFEAGKGKSWGVFVRANISAADCFSHLVKFLKVKGEDDEQFYFRFYDPRVLRVFIPSCSPEQLKDFFGPVKIFTAEDEDPDYAVQFWLQNYNLKTKRIPLSQVFADFSNPVITEKQKVEIKAVQAESESGGKKTADGKMKRSFLN